MNRIVIICATILMTASIFAQTPEKISYQAVIRDSADELVTNTQVGMQISILQGTANGNAVYVETQTLTTNVNGLVSVEIGTGITSADFTSIDWSAGPYFIKTETDPSGGTTYSITGTSQLMSVPYALYAKESGSSVPGPAGEDGVGITSTTDNNDGTFTFNFNDGSSFTTSDLTGPQGVASPGDNPGDMLYWDGSSWVSIEATQNEGATLQMIGGVPQWVGGTPPPEVPDAPTITSVSAGDGQVDITFEAPTDDGGSPITGYTATSSPGNITGSIAQAGSGIITVTGLTNGKAYTFTVTATNSVGTSSPSSASNSVTPSSTPQVGNFRDGGVVFYVAPTPTDLDGDGTLDQGLVCAVDDQSLGAKWGCWAEIISGADGNGIGTGADNTSDILADCSQSGIAAKLCDDYTGGGYNDWLLPSKDELDEMYQNKATINATAGANGGSSFASAYYWSSTEYSISWAWAQYFFNGSQKYFNYDKNLTLRVRAVRAF